MPTSAGEWLANMHQSQHSAMLAGMLGGGAAAPETLAGGIISRSMAVGRPMLSGIAGMIGLDPMSLGIRAGMGAWNAGAGILGAGLAGAGTMAGVGIAGAGLAFAGSQMASGAQQQMALNQSLRGFNFMNNQGGMGFTSNQGFQIGQLMRHMTHDFGPQGEVATFGELSRLASNMGRMGMAQNVKSVAEFKEKFKEMVTTLKQVAADMGTSLEEAQKFVNSMKGSGIFRAADQLKMSAGTRMSAMAGGLAMSEVTGMANIGSQISRSIGGLGRQGAFAGVKTIEQIGIAQKIGAISEEDIYNATGLTGAEGRQALATAQLQQSAAFMSSGRGRRFLASIAGKDGSLNQEAVAEWLSGGNMTTGRTMELAYQNLAGVGRANFIRNEGRLRGAALEQFGGLAQSLVYKQWLASRGYDPNNMDDRSMLAFQRFSGMGRDEADLAIKQIQAMPEMLREYAETKRHMGHSDALSRYHKTHGIEGLKRKFDQVREGIQGKLQDAGSRILQYGTETLESWFNGVMGAYVDLSTEGLDQITRSMELGGGASSSAQYRRFFGQAGKGVMGGRSGMSSEYRKMMQNNLLKMSAMAGSQDESIAAFGLGNSEFVKIATLGSTGKSPQEQMASFRASLAERAKTDATAKAVLEKFDRADEGGKAGILQTIQEKAGVAKEGNLLSQLSKSQFDYTPGGQFKSEADFEKALGRQLAGANKDDDTSRYYDSRWYTKVAGVGAGAFMALGGGLNWAFSNMYGRFGGLNKALYGSDDPVTREEVLRVALKTAVNTTNYLDRGVDAMTGKDDRFRAMARTFRNKETQALISDMFAGGRDADLARSDVLNRIQKMRSGQGDKTFDKYDESTKGEIEALAGVSLASKYGSVLDEYNRTGGTAEGLDALVDEYRKITGNKGAKVEDIMKSLNSMREAGQGALAMVHMANFQKDFDRIGRAQATEKESAVKMGLAEYKDGKLVLTAKGQRGREGLSKDALAADDLGMALLNYDMTKPDDKVLNKYLESQNISREKYNKMGADEKKSIDMLAAHQGYYDMTQESYEKIGALSMEEKRKLAKTRAGTKIGDIAAYEIQVEDRYRSLSRGPGGDTAAISKLMGLNLTKEQLEGIESEADPAKKVAALMAKAGIAGDKNLEQDLIKALGSKTLGGKAQGVDAALANMSDESKKKLQESKASQDDPNYRVLSDIRTAAKQQYDALKLIAQHTGATAEEIKNLDKSGPEGSGQPPKK